MESLILHYQHLFHQLQLLLIDAFLNLFLGCISLFITNTKFTSNVKAEDLLKVELNTEIKKGKFLIGLKQYLGGENDSFSKKNLLKIYAYGIINLTLSASLSSTTAFVDRCLFNFELL